MTKIAFVYGSIAVAAALGLLGCGQEPVDRPAAPESEREAAHEKDITTNTSLMEVAESSSQWTGIAVSDAGRIFVSFPRWSDTIPMSVGVFDDAGNLKPYPNEQWNNWSEDADPGNSFVCVQSVVTDRSGGTLWILDPANPRFQGVVDGGAKLVQCDLKDNRVVEVFRFDQGIARKTSYLNDVRVDPARRLAYITDSGAGAIIVLDLLTGRSRRVLEYHPSTQSEGTSIVIGGAPWRRADGSKPEVHADGIALSDDGKVLYFHALTGSTLYSIDTEYLQDPTLSPRELGAKVQVVADTGPCDGMLMGPDGMVYLTAVADHAIKAYHPGGELRTVISDDRLLWPDTLAMGPGGFMFVTTSQIHRMPNPQQPFRILKFSVGDQN